VLYLILKVKNRNPIENGKVKKTAAGIFFKLDKKEVNCKHVRNMLKIIVLQNNK